MSSIECMALTFGQKVNLVDQILLGKLTVGEFVLGQIQSLSRGCGKSELELSLPIYAFIPRKLIVWFLGFFLYKDGELMHVVLEEKKT